MGSKIVIIGGGVVGAAIAYELSKTISEGITLLEKEAPGAGASGAAFGLLMGAISKKTKGRGWRLRHGSLQYYRQLLPELEQLTGQPLPHNPHGILKLLPATADLTPWAQLQATRQQQGYGLELLGPQALSDRFPYLDLAIFSQGIYSPDDGQIQPQPLTEALIQGVIARGVTVIYPCTVENLQYGQGGRCLGVTSDRGDFPADHVIVAAGIGSNFVTQRREKPLTIRPILGQALEIQLDQDLAPDQPVITAEDVHLLPQGQGRYWVGATLEFPPGDRFFAEPDPDIFHQLQQQAETYCPALTQGTITRTWWGHRPRPEGQGAPVIEPLTGSDNVILATGHYRNGVLLAPATAIAVAQYFSSDVRP